MGDDDRIRNMVKKIIFILILVLGAWWRFYNLSEVPNGMYVDETVIGYNAWSLAETGRDEYGVKWPIFLRSFGAFSSPLYTHLTAGVVKVIGLSNFSVRLLSATAGTLMIVWLYLILGELKYKWWLRMIGALLIALAPWSVFLSRIALEGHLALSFATGGIWMFLKSKNNSRWWLGVGVMLALSSWTYQAARPISWLLGIGFLIIVGYKQWKNWWLISGVVFFLLTQIPQLLLINLPAFSQRGVGLFYHDVPNKFKEFWSQATAYLSPLGLFWRPDEDPQRSLPALSNFYPFLVLFYLPGWLLVKEKFSKLEGKLWLLLLISGLVIPSLTKDPFSSVRGQFLILPIMLVIIWGVEWWSRKVGVKIIAIAFVLMLLVAQLWLWRSLLVLLPYERAATWGYGYEQIAEQIKKYPDENWIVEQTRQHPVYIQLLYYLRYPPTEYHGEIGDWGNKYYTDTDYDLTRSFGNVEVRNIDWENDIYIEQIMVGDELSISQEQATEHFLEEVFVIEDPNGKILFRGYRTNPSRKIIGQ